MTWLRLLLRHLRLSGVRWLVLALVIAATSALAMVWPRWLDTTVTHELRRDLGSASATFVDPSTQPGRLPLQVPDPETPPSESTASRVWQPVTAALTQHRAAMPELLRGMLGDGQAWTTWAPLSARDASVPDRGLMYVQPASAPDVWDHARVVEGRLPAIEVPEPSEDGWVRLEVALSVGSADEMRWKVGDVRATGTADANGMPVEVALVGTFEADDPHSDYWQNAATLLRPTFSGTNDTGMIVTVRGLVSTGAGVMTATTAVVPQTSRLWYPLDTAGIDAQNAAEVADQLRTGLDAGGLGYHFATDAPERIDEVLARAATAQAVLGLTVAAPAGVLLALLALAAQVVVAPRRGGQHLMAQRGGTLTQHRSLLSVEAALVCLPAAAIGGAAAQRLVPVDVTPWWWLGPVAVGLAPVLAMATGSPTPRPAAAPRVALEATLALLAVVALVQLVVRGTDDSAGTDVLAVAAPLLLTVVTALACVRLVPLVLGPLARRLGERDDLVAPLGAALAVRRAAPMTATVATVAGTAVALLGVLIGSSVDAGRTSAAMAYVGADVRVAGLIDQGRIDALREVPGVAAVAPVETTTSVALDVGESHLLTKLYAVGPDLAAAQRGVDDAVAVPPVGGIVVSDTMPVRVGDTVVLETSPTVTLTVTATAPAAPGLTGAQDWMVVNRESVAGTAPARVVTVTYLAVDPAADPTSVADAVREVVGPGIAVSTARDRLDQLRTAPTAVAMSTGIGVVMVLGLLAAVLALALALADRSARRTRVIAVLRTMGLPPRAEVRLVLWEAGPVVAVAVLAGAVLGLALTWLVLVTTDVRPFTGGSAQPSLTVDPATLGGAVVAVLAAAGIAVVVSAFAAARRSAAVVLRAGEDT